MKQFFLFLFSIGFTFSIQAQTIVDVTASNDDFSTLVAAVKAADLVDALSAEGPYTVFAPTNSAFGKIDSATLNALLEEENKETLTNILTYHVVAGNVMASDVVSALKLGGGKTKVETLNGQSFWIMSEDGKIWIKDMNGNLSEIIKTDIQTENGVIHVIDTVIMPNSDEHKKQSKSSSCH